jgi:hypothetical protein
MSIRGSRAEMRGVNCSVPPRPPKIPRRDTWGELHGTAATSKNTARHSAPNLRYVDARISRHVAVMNPRESVTEPRFKAMDSARGSVTKINQKFKYTHTTAFDAQIPHILPHTPPVYVARSHMVVCILLFPAHIQLVFTAPHYSCALLFKDYCG